VSSGKTIEEIENEIVEEFSLFDNWDDKYEYIIDLGKNLPPLDDQFKKDENKVRGCQSTVWLVAEYNEGRMLYKAESDAIIVKGLISMLIRVLSEQRPDDIINARLDFINKIGMMSHLAQTRSNGIVSMVKQIKNYALVFKLKNEGVNAEELEFELIDAGLEEMGESTGENEEEVLVLRCAFNDFGNLQKALEEKGLTPISAEVEWIPTTTVELGEEQAQDVLKLVDKLEQDEDVQKVFHNLV
jgi:cysteine desulfuration protein SufE